MTNSIAPSRGLNTRDAAQYIGISFATLRKMRLEDYQHLKEEKSIEGPKWLKIGKRIVYLRDELDRWLDSRFGAAL